MIGKSEDMRKQVESLVNSPDKTVALIAKALLKMDDSFVRDAARIKRLEAEVARLRG